MHVCRIAAEKADLCTQCPSHAVSQEQLQHDFVSAVTHCIGRLLGLYINIITGQHLDKSKVSRACAHI